MDKTDTQHLAWVGFERRMPSTALQPYIKWFWQIRTDHKLAQTRQEFMHSYGALSTIFNWEDALQFDNQGDSNPIIVEEIHPVSRQLVLTGKLHLFGILFRPGGASRLFNRPVIEMINASQLSLLNMHELHEYLGSYPRIDDKVSYLEAKLLGSAPGLDITHPILPRAIALIERSRGQAPIPIIASQVNMSERQLERLFRDQVGLSPKKYSRLIRLHHTRTALKQLDTSSFADIALISGFHDQAHFNNEFKKSIGITPKEYLARHKERQMQFYK